MQNIVAIMYRCCKMCFFLKTTGSASRFVKVTVVYLHSRFHRHRNYHQKRAKRSCSWSLNRTGLEHGRAVRYGTVLYNMYITTSFFVHLLQSSVFQRPFNFRPVVDMALPDVDADYSNVPKKGLIVLQPWLQMILDKKKIWEIRPDPCKFRGLFCFLTLALFPRYVV